MYLRQNNKTNGNHSNIPMVARLMTANSTTKQEELWTDAELMYQITDITREIHAWMYTYMHDDIVTFPITDPLYVNSAGPALSFYFSSTQKKLLTQKVVLPAIWDTLTPTHHHCNKHKLRRREKQQRIAFGRFCLV